MSFDWQVDEEARWEQDAGTGGQTRRPPRPGFRRWLTAAAIMVFVGVFGSVQLVQRVEQVNTDLEQAVRAAFTLSLSAIEQQDLELWLTLVDKASDLEWRRHEESLLQARALYDRRAWGLFLTPGSESVGPLTLSPDLAEAELPFTAAYQSVDGQTIYLEHIVHYRERNDQWLRTEAHDEFWGSMSTQEGRWLMLTYPGRDEAVAVRLAADLDALLQRLCSAPDGFNCLPETYFTITLSQDALSLVSTLAPERTVNVQRMPTGRLLLPAPSLLGYPTDEVAYQAIYRSYARQMVTHLFERVYRWRYGSTPDFYDAAYVAELQRLDLLPPPAAPTALPAGNLLPAASVQLLCETKWTGASLYRLSLPDGGWQAEMPAERFVGLRDIENQAGVILLQPDEEIDLRARAHLSLWRQNEFISISHLFPQPLFPIVSGATTADGNRLLVYFGGAGRTGDRFGYIELDKCSAEQCTLETLPYTETFAPDGRHAIAVQPFDNTLQLVSMDGALNHDLGYGYGAFWLDNNTFGFLQTNGNMIDDGESSLTLGRLDTLSPQVVLSYADLQAALLPQDSAQAELLGILTQVLSANQILLMGLSDVNALAGSMQMVVYDVPGNRLTPIASRASSRQLLVAPGGERLLSHELGSDFLQQWLYVYDLAAGKEQIVPLAPKPAFTVGQTMDYGWSPDGEWLLLLDGGVLHFIAPAQETHYKLQPPIPGCTYAAWAN